MHKMKDSGIEWIGQVPEEWNLIRFKDKYKNVKEIVGERANEYERLALTLNGVIRRPKDDFDGQQPKGFDGYQILNEGDFIFKMIDLQNISTSRVGLSPYTGLVSPAYIRFTARENNLVGKYIYYFWMSMYYNHVFNSLGGDGVRSALNAADMGTFFIPFPDVDVQKKIVQFIDNKILKVDELILNEQSQIDNLKQYKQSLVTEVVFQGLNPKIKKKKSGVEWLGDIPECFEIAPIGSLFAIKKDIIGKEPETVLSITQQGLKIKDISVNEGQMANSYANYQIVNVSDFAMNHMDLLTGWIDISKYEGVTSPDYRVFRLKDVNMNPDYFLYVFQSYYKNKIFYAYGQGVANMGRWRLPAANFNKISIPVPPFEMQNEIVDYLNKKVAEIDRLIDIKQDKITQLLEYKKSIIYEYVTGKKEAI